ncbi:MAG: zinc ribbon domain-containing protein [Bryobacteraceae bacterium]
MYCDRCGSQLQDRQQFCGSCGKPVAPVASSATYGRVARNLPVLGILWIVYSAIPLLGGVFTAHGLPGLMPWVQRTALAWRHAPVLLPGPIFGMFGLWLTIMGVLGIIAGVGLLARRPWARTMAIVFGCLSLVSFPFGTALGIYTLWVLASSESGRQYRAAA